MAARMTQRLIHIARKSVAPSMETTCRFRSVFANRPQPDAASRTHSPAAHGQAVMWPRQAMAVHSAHSAYLHGGGHVRFRFRKTSRSAPRRNMPAERNIVST